MNFRSGAGLAGEHPLGYQLGQLVGIAGQGEFQSPDPVHSQSNRAYRGQLVLTLDLAVELADPFEMGRTATVLVALRTYLSSERSSGQFAAPLDAGDAFVLAHAFRGVLRAMTSEDAPPQGEIERSLTRLVVSYLS